MNRCLPRAGTSITSTPPTTKGPSRSRPSSDCSAPTTPTPAMATATIPIPPPPARAVKKNPPPRGKEKNTNNNDLSGLEFDGTYYLRASGTPDKPIVIKGAGDGEAIFDGAGTAVLFDMMIAN